MNDELPGGWAIGSVQEITEDLQAGFASGEKSVGGGVAHLRMNNIGLNGELVLTLVRTVPERLARPQYDLRPGDVLVCTTNSADLVGKCAFFDLPGRYAFSNHLTRLRANPEEIDARYLRWYLWLQWKTGIFNDKCKHWVNQSTIPKGALAETEVAVAPLAEQRRIVAKIEALLTKAQSSQGRLDKIPGILKRFRKAVVAAAATGRLTADWRGECKLVETAAVFVRRIQEDRRRVHEVRDANAPATKERKPRPPKNNFVAAVDESAEGLPSGWCVAHIGDIADCLDHLRVPVNKDTRAARQGPIPYYGANGQVGWIDKFLFDEELVLVVEDETFIGREKPFSYVIRGKAWVNNHAHVLRSMGGMPVDYLNICLSYYDFTPLTSGTTGRRKLTQEGLMTAPMWIAPLPEQQEVVRRVSELFALASRIEARYEKAKTHVDKVTQAVLAKAFRGDLVPTEAELARRAGRSYETAEELLARIQAQQTAHGGRGTPRARAPDRT
jgi:Restriction endonuclease S subunits